MKEPIWETKHAHTIKTCTILLMSYCIFKSEKYIDLQYYICMNFYLPK